MLNTMFISNRLKHAFKNWQNKVYLMVQHENQKKLELKQKSENPNSS